MDFDSYPHFILLISGQTLEVMVTGKILGTKQILSSHHSQVTRTDDGSGQWESLYVQSKTSSRPSDSRRGGGSRASGPWLVWEKMSRSETGMHADAAMGKV